MDSLDKASHTAIMSAEGTDKRGQGGASRRSARRARGGGEDGVDVVTDFTITGRLARFGRGGMIEDVSKRMCATSRRACRRRSTSEPEAPEAPAQARGGGRSGPCGGRGRRRVGRRRCRGGVRCAGPAAAAPRVQPQAAKPVHGIRLVLSVLWERIVRFFARLFGRGEK